MSPDSIKLDLMLHHPSRDPKGFTTLLEVEPWAALRAGAKIGPVVRKSSVWMATLYEGSAQGKQFSNALQKVVSLLNAKAKVFQDLIDENGDASLTINHSVLRDEGVVSDLRFEPAFLAELAKYEIAFVLRGWSTGEEAQ